MGDDYIRDYGEISKIVGFPVFPHNKNHSGKAKVNVDILLSFIDDKNTQCDELRISSMSTVLRQSEYLIRKYIKDRMRDYPSELKELFYSNDKKTILKTHVLQSKVSAPSSHSGIKEVQQPDSGYLPNREDFESAYRSLARMGQEVSIDDVLDKIASDAIKAGITLKDQWRTITELNINE